MGDFRPRHVHIVVRDFGARHDYGSLANDSCSGSGGAFHPTMLAPNDGLFVGFGVFNASVLTLIAGEFRLCH